MADTNYNGRQQIRLSGAVTQLYDNSILLCALDGQLYSLYNRIEMLKQDG